MLAHDVTLGLVVQGTKCACMWWLWVLWRGVPSQWLGQLEYIISEIMWSLVSTVGDLQWLRGLLVLQLCFQVQWLGIKPVVVAGVRGMWIWGPAAGSCVMIGAGCRYTHSGRGQGKQHVPRSTGHTGSCGALAVSIHSCDCRVLPWVHSMQRRLVTGIKLELYKCTAGGASPKHAHGIGGQPWGSKAVFCTHAATEPGCQCRSQALIGREAGSEERYSGICHL